MQHYAESGPKRTVLAYRACEEETWLLGQEADRCFEGHANFDLQCGESLAIAANHIGEEVFGVEQLLLRGLARGTGIALELARLGERVKGGAKPLTPVAKACVSRRVKGLKEADSKQM